MAVTKLILSCPKCGKTFERTLKFGATIYCSPKCYWDTRRYLASKVDRVALFWSNVDKRTADECWSWIGTSRHVFGYGFFRYEGRKRTAHRLAWELTNGPIQSGLGVCHRCDNPPCCNPGHLFLGTPAENLADMAAKGRTGNMKLTQSDIIAIRVSEGSQKQIAALFGVSQAVISRIIRKEAWKHVQ